MKHQQKNFDQKKNIECSSDCCSIGVISVYKYFFLCSLLYSHVAFLEHLITSSDCSYF